MIQGNAETSTHFHRWEKAVDFDKRSKIMKSTNISPQRMRAKSKGDTGRDNLKGAKVTIPVGGKSKEQLRQKPRKEKNKPDHQSGCQSWGSEQGSQNPKTTKSGKGKIAKCEVGKSDMETG